MTAQTPFKRLILRAVLRNVSPMMIRVLAVPDYLDLPEFDEVFRTVLGWDGLGFIFRVHGHEYNSFRRITPVENAAGFPTASAGEVSLHLRRDRSLGMGVPALEEEDGDDAPMCLGGRGAAPPEHCGGPTGYRLMLKRQKER